MTTITVPSVKLAIHFRANDLPRIDPGHPLFTIDLGGITIAASVNAKAAKRLASHTGAVVLQGKLTADRGRLTLLEAGFQFIPPAETVAVAASERVAGGLTQEC
jgi:hypothetical protein